jgi:Histidine phosphatase superfamily (branch 1)
MSESTSRTRLILVRHGATAWTESGRYQGSTADVPLWEGLTGREASARDPELQCRPGSITVIDVQSGRYVVRLLNDTCHLQKDYLCRGVQG